MGWSRRSLRLGAALLAAGLARALAEEAPPATLPAVAGAGQTLFLRLKGEARLTHRDKDGCWVGTGGIVLKRGDATLTASRIVYWEKEEAVYAEGLVIFEDPDRRIFAERCYYSWTSQKGRLEKGRIIRHVPDRGIHYYLDAERIDLDGPRTDLHEVTLSTCSFATPHYAWRAKEMILTQGQGGDLGQLVSSGNVLEIGRTAVGYLPVLSRNLGKAHFPLKSVKAGRQSSLGIYVRANWEIPVGTETDLFLHTDYFSKHDLAGGPELRWAKQDKGQDYEGRALAYGLNDPGNDPGGSEPARRDRGWLYAVDHRFHPEGWSSILELSKLSDSNFLPLYFEKEARTGKEQESRAYVQRIRGDYAGSFLARPNLNRFQDQVEYLPKAEFRVLSKSFLDGKLLWNSTTEAASAVHRTSSLKQAPDEDVQRLDTRQEAIVPFPMGPVHAQAFADERATLYSKTRDGQADRVRVISGGGLRLGTQFLKPLATTSEFWNIRAMRHIVVPQVEYRTDYDSTLRSDSLQQIDAVDAADRFERLTFSLDNIWQAKRRQARRVETDQPEAEPAPLVTADFATLFLKMNYFPQSGRDNEFHPWGPLEGRFRVLPRDYVAAYTDWTYNPEVSGGLETWNIGTTFNPDYAEAFGSDRFGRSRFSARALESDKSGGPALGSLSNRWSLNLENRFVKQDSSTLNATVTYQFSERWSTAVSQEYEWLEGVRGDRRLLFRRDLHEWLLEFSLENDKTHGNSVFFLVYPKGLF